MNLQQQNSPSRTISRTLKTAKLIDAFWERWLVHGVDLKDIQKVRTDLNDLNQWLTRWGNLAEEKLKEAENLELQNLTKEAEFKYRQTALYFNLIYWIYPTESAEKKDYYNKCLYYFYKADSISPFETEYKTLNIDGNYCPGRIRIPNNPKGCILIINPIDSSKEELFKYEKDFLDEGFVTLSFDGPGQGESYLMNEVIGTKIRWEKFINQYIDLASHSFAGIPIYLFGTSIGASWALYGSSHKKVEKVVAVSPAIELEKMNMPSYFTERLKCTCIVENREKRAIPTFDEINYKAPVTVFHGNKDMMVPDTQMYNLFQKISTDKKLIEYEDEGHCCNNKLGEIRRLSLQWFNEKNKRSGDSS